MVRGGFWTDGNGKTAKNTDARWNALSSFPCRVHFFPPPVVVPLDEWRRYAEGGPLSRSNLEAAAGELDQPRMTLERIRRYDDERLYQPRIHSRRIRELHRISEETGEPMTVLVDQAVSQFIEQYESRSKPNSENHRNSDSTDLSPTPEDRSRM